MLDRKIVEAFAAEVEAGRYVEAIEGFYAPHATMQENGDAPRVGREALIAGERQMLAQSRSITAERTSPILIGDDHVAIRWRFEITRSNGAAMTLDEIALQRWEGGKIVEEQFVYDPKQMGR